MSAVKKIKQTNEATEEQTNIISNIYHEHRCHITKDATKHDVCDDEDNDNNDTMHKLDDITTSLTLLIYR